MQEFTHFDKDGNAIMVDVSAKEPSVRTAEAEGKITMSQNCYDAVKSGKIGKGDVLAVARIAGIMAVKQTPALIPLCHTILINKASIDFEFCDELRQIKVTCTVKCEGVTGVEMEALTGASIALLTIYDMCKAVDKSMEISDIYLSKKTGGKSGEYYRQEK